MDYEIVMGLEVHVELATNSKLFCSCSAKFGADQNENVCPACAGMPGLLPVVNKKAVELGITAGIVTNCEISRRTTFDKKNYFYPDLSTGFQITQLFAPICTNGYIDIETENGKKQIRIKQIHIEEDAGKLVHEPRTGSSLVDYNRASIPLTEIVSQPDFRSSDEVIAYLEKLRSLLVFAGVSDCKMQEGSMRADINISVRKKGDEKLGTRTEMKNMNSLKAIVRAIDYESQRHIEALETKYEELVQETRRWDDNKGMSFSMRNKEDATDYRYFPNADLPPVYIDEEWINRVRENLPESAEKKFNRFVSDLGLPEYDSKILTGSKNLSAIFEKTLSFYNKPKEISNWLIVELMNLIKDDSKNIEDVNLNVENFAKVLNMLESKSINRSVAKELFAQIYKNDIDPEKYVEENGLKLISDDSLIRQTCSEAIKSNPKTIAEYKAGSQKVFGFFVGKVMKSMGGKADPQTVNKILRELLEKE